MIRFEATKMKDADYPPPTAFRPAVVELGISDDEGNPSTSIVLDATAYEPPPATPGNAGRGKGQTTATEILKKLQDTAEQRLSSRGFDPDTARIAVEDWRLACSDKGIKDRRDWKRIKDSLVKLKIVEIENGFAAIL